MDKVLGPLSFYHWLFGTILVSWCSIEIFYRPNGSVIPYQFMGTLVNVALFLFLQNNVVYRDEILYCVGGAAVFFVISFFTSGSKKPGASTVGKPQVKKGNK